MGKPREIGALRQQLDLGQVLPPLRLGELRHARVHDLAESFVLVVVPLASRPDWISQLTPSELEVTRLAVSGLSNRAMARRRGAAQSTIANQLASVYRKLGISGRRELRARISGQSDVHDR